ncbi:MAG: hypothetical protein HDQ87_10025 [Clostridia bacterium]|nr:hypothetical protein [Clostridia bacterium]
MRRISRRLGMSPAAQLGCRCQLEEREAGRCLDLVSCSIGSARRPASVPGCSGGSGGFPMSILGIVQSSRIRYIVG